MPVKSRGKRRPNESFIDEDINDIPSSLEPYKVLGLDNSATADEIKSAYRKAALRYHPDKAPVDKKQEAHSKFQEIASAYAVLSDPKRKKRYDLTGSTSESLSIDDDDFCWIDFFREQFKEIITEDSIKEFAKTYKGSKEEKKDIITAYRESKGRWEHIYEVVMLSDPLDDEDRFRAIIDQAILDGEVESYKAYARETEKSKKRRMDSRIKEKEELSEMAEAVGANELLKASSTAEADATLKALIQKNQVGRSSFLDNLEAKYATKSKTSRGKNTPKRPSKTELPSEEAFLETREKLDQKASGNGKKKRVKI